MRRNLRHRRRPAPYSWAWDLNNDGVFTDADGRTPSTTFTTTGPHVVSVRITDNQNGDAPRSRSWSLPQASPAG